MVDVTIGNQMDTASKKGGRWFDQKEIKRRRIHRRAKQNADFKVVRSQNVQTEVR